MGWDERGAGVPVGRGQPPEVFSCSSQSPESSAATRASAPQVGAQLTHEEGCAKRSFCRGARPGAPSPFSFPCRGLGIDAGADPPGCPRGTVLGRVLFPSGRFEPKPLRGHTRTGSVRVGLRPAGLNPPRVPAPGGDAALGAGRVCVTGRRWWGPCCSFFRILGWGRPP